MAEVEKIHCLSNNGNSKSWTPVIGEETNELLDRILGSDEDTKKRVKEETYHIMRLCGNPKVETNSDTGLVVGYVQSGKTLSFTALTALAKDNGYQLVIIIAGTKKNLINQSYQRLKRDLNINQGFPRKWKMLNNPKNLQDKNTIECELNNWKDESIPKDLKRTLLITVLKNKNHLENLIKVLKKLKLRGVPALVVDDEGDQASMNTKARNNAKKKAKDDSYRGFEMSTIYRRIREIKSTLPHHTFIQYTATPQALLFINIMDNLSPNFIQLLKPGEKYTGGISFFKENHYIVREIPYSDIPSNDNSFTKPPNSLLEAMHGFFLGVSAGILFNSKIEGNPRNRTMMVHPSRLMAEHENYRDWISNIKGQWAKVLKRDDSNSSKIKLINEFKTAYEDLHASLKDLPSFQELLQNLVYSIRNTAVEELNSKAGSLVDWDNHYSFILIGGQAMDRGVTVEGLTVTYMPRSKGVGNADTLQQRARFFGYRKDYIGFCRVYLDAENIHLFREYVEHEEDIRNKLQECKRTDRPLNDLDRQFVLDDMFNITRRNILSNDVERSKFGNTWLKIKAPHDSDSIIEDNKNVYNEFLKKYSDKFHDDEGHHERTEEQKHLIAKISLKDIYTNFTSKLKYTRLSDSNSFISLNAVITLYLDEFPPEESFVYLMKKGRARERSLNKKDEILNLFQGKNPTAGEVIYPGDEKLKKENNVSLQIHILNLKETNYKDIVSIAIWIPERLSKSLISIKK